MKKINRFEFESYLDEEIFSTVPVNYFKDKETLYISLQGTKLLGI